MCSAHIRKRDGESGTSRPGVASKDSTLVMPSYPRYRRFITAASILAAALMRAQTIVPPSNTQRFSVTGVVRNSVTGEPLKRALVRLMLAGGEQRAVLTGQDGRFQINDVAAGSIWASAQRPGYFDSGSGRPVQVTSGRNEIQLLLAPEAKLVGTITDNNGEPIVGLRVGVLAERLQEGRKQWFPEGDASTDENGRYRATQLRPGVFVVCTASQTGQTVAPAEVYPPRCYPNSPDMAAAQRIKVDPGETAHADLTMQLEQGFGVRGSISGMQGNRRAWIEGPDHNPWMGGAMVQINPATGRFLIPWLTNGAWRVHFQASDGQGQSSEAIENITINGAPVSGLQVILNNGINIPIEVTAPSQAANGVPANSASVQQVRLRRRDIGWNQLYLASQLPSDGNHNVPVLALPDIPPGSYDVTAQVAGKACLGALTYMGSDLARNPLTIEPGSAGAPINVALSSECATLNITVRSDRAKPQGVLLLMPANVTIDPQIVPVSAATVMMQNLSPGTYRLYAVSKLDDLEYTNPEAMRDVPSQEITLTSKQQAQASVEITER